MSEPNDLSARLRRADKAHLWHPFTQMAEWAAGDPVVIVSADREFLIDTEGNRYIDGTSSLWCNLHGHRRVELDDAVRAQLGRVAHSTLLGLASAPSIDLAERLVAMAPGGDPKKHRASIKLPKGETTLVVCELSNYDQVTEVCKQLVQNEGVQSFILCPGFTHEGVAKVANAVGPEIAINVARGDPPSGMITGQILAKEGWLPAGH